MTGSCVRVFVSFSRPILLSYEQILFVGEIVLFFGLGECEGRHKRVSRACGARLDSRVQLSVAICVTTVNQTKA